MTKFGSLYRRGSGTGCNPVVLILGWFDSITVHRRLLKPGGSGGFINKEHQRKCTIAGSKAFVEKLRTDENFNKNWRLNNSLAKKGEKNPLYGKCFYGFKDKHHSDESKQKMRIKNSSWYKKFTI